jgi:hypothetical protein
MMNSASWVVVSKATGRAVLETFSEAVAASVNRNAYDVLPVLEYLVGLNQPKRERQDDQPPERAALWEIP